VSILSATASPFASPVSRLRSLMPAREGIVDRIRGNTYAATSDFTASER
jgi:hypothetical protein